MILKDLIVKCKTPHTPIWIMRQAGRHLPEYLEIRKNHQLTEMFFLPEIISKVTLQPIERYDLDAAIIFSDILTIPKALGMDLSFSNNSKPKLSGIENVKDNFLEEDFIKALSPVYQAISDVKEKLKNKKPLIGFSGAPWTLAIYMLSGGESTNFAKAKIQALANKDQTLKLISLLTKAVYLHLEQQIIAGADIVKIFDSSAGLIGDDFFDQVVIDSTKEIVAKLKENYSHIPIICFPRESSFRYHRYLEQVKPDVLALDFLIPLELAREFKKQVIVQGNLDPSYLFCSKEEIKKQVMKIEDYLGRGEYIFNLGHGILPETPPENVQYLVDLLRR